MARYSEMLGGIQCAIKGYTVQIVDSYNGVQLRIFWPNGDYMHGEYCANRRAAKKRAATILA